DFSVGPVRHRGALSGVATAANLRPVFDDATGRVVQVPAEGLVLGTRLAEKLGVGRGDKVWVHILEGRRPSVQMPVADLFETYIGMPAYVDFEALHRVLKEGPRVEYISLFLDPALEGDFFRELKETPLVSAVVLRRAAVDAFYETLAESMMVFISFFVAFACALGFGVAYNSSRIALSERGRELATLRVLGFSRAEVAYILLGEVGLLTLLALPFGCWLGLVLTQGMAAAFDTELFRVAIFIRPATYGLAMVILLGAVAASAALVRRRIDHLDLVEVLKTRE
ncbi:MAG: FtsX-like permease family protein, partial [Acidobacteria bacterium]|nr:FtsX-like permease family protein [Acidobacteriota bacterium]